MTQTEFPLLDNIYDYQFAGATSTFRVLIVYTRWHHDITTALVKSAIQTLETYDISNIHVLPVPGCYELPFAIKNVLSNTRNDPSVTYDVVIPIGVLVKGETKHFEYISKSVSQQLMNIGLEFNTHVLFGVLTCLSIEQARQRAGIFQSKFYPSKSLGASWAHTAVEMAMIRDFIIIPQHYGQSAQYASDSKSIPSEEE